MPLEFRCKETGLSVYCDVGYAIIRKGNIMIEITPLEWKFLEEVLKIKNKKVRR